MAEQRGQTFMSQRNKPIVNRRPLTPYALWVRDNPGIAQPIDERQYPSYPHGDGPALRYCCKERKWRPKSEFPQDPNNPGQVAKGRMGVEILKECVRCSVSTARFHLVKKKQKLLVQIEAAAREGEALRALQVRLTSIERAIAIKNAQWQALAGETNKELLAEVVRLGGGGGGGGFISGKEDGDGEEDMALPGMDPDGDFNMRDDSADRFLTASLTAALAVPDTAAEQPPTQPLPAAANQSNHADDPYHHENLLSPRPADVQSEARPTSYPELTLSKHSPAPFNQALALSFEDSPNQHHPPLAKKKRPTPLPLHSQMYHTYQASGATTPTTKNTTHHLGNAAKDSDQDDDNSLIDPQLL
ncbi:hypothetical protein DSL72_008471 [Monilinia vaccinii-corymbosi]|uniref:Uncharacterized protein n=1 Tax=Monilinia vaccinii-corymbosi TaxID=61207 RepID=A0A8A3PKZ0_9HELO|nr:hypothetical protein DSL72_008471 [Monilinia vaccinii-corymbosi]